MKKELTEEKLFSPSFLVTKVEGKQTLKVLTLRSQPAKKKKKKIVLRTEQRPAAISVLRELEMDAL